MKPISLRRDIVSRASYPQGELRRFVVRSGELLEDKGERLPGRGYYLHPDGDPEKAIKAFARLLRRPLSNEEEALIRG